QVRGEAALRAHHVDPVSRLQILVRPDGEESAEVALDTDRDAVGRWRTADRIAAPDFVTLDVRAQGHVLTGQVLEVVAQFVWNGERHLDAFGSECAHLGDLEFMESSAPTRCRAHSA